MAGQGAQAAQRGGTGTAVPLDGWAVAVTREEGRWRAVTMDRTALGDLDSAITALRALRSTGAVLGLLDVDDEFFVIVRPVPGGVSLLLSDAVAALDYDVAADVLDLLRLDVPDEDDVDDDPWPEGDLSLLADLGVPADELAVLVDEIDLYPDEQLTAIARRCGFAEELAKIVETAPAS
ncbi:tRNA adenosine deaminase-associated protein [Actinomycetospora atypica]|uniref:tRNA adenosine deaminase-associated protein n=1 Tax=Actinomycetospora atypica TaxID=1290095 RepID=A0ABV9YV69_9PSEU